MLASLGRSVQRAARSAEVSTLWGALHRATLSSSAGSSRPSASDESASSTGIPKLIVFGGRGFVGSHICQEALSTGLHVVGISRSGTPPVGREPWTQQVEWVRGNALEPQTYQDHLEGAAAVISCVGAFGSQAEMLRINGTANVTAVEAAKAAGVPRFVYMSANIPSVPGIDMLLGGYINGKAEAEEAVRSHYPEGGVILKPGVIYGNRVVSSSLTLPLHLAFQPVETALSYVQNSKQLSTMPVVGALFVPPVNVHAVAKAAVRAATDPAIPAGDVDAWAIQQYK